jgi:hypothetical protein
LSPIWTFIFSISKQFGAHIEKTTMKEMSAFMLIIGKIIEENLLYLHILMKCAKIGIQKTLLLLIRMVAILSIDVHLVTVGKNRSFTLTILNLSLVCMVIVVKNLIAPIFILI